MSLYRTYRPQEFSDVVGQEHVVTTLRNAAAQGKIAHAYLFAGSRGTGKTSMARILARHILLQGIDDASLRSRIEQGVRDGSLVDLIEIDGASNRKIEHSRELVEKIQFSPVITKAKVYIIDEVHMLTKEAFNALLKTLEEPPAYAYFILATTELQKIPPTIQSRCQRFSFHQIEEEQIIRRLEYIAERERITIDRTALRAIAREAQGGLRDAIALLDQLRSLPAVTLEDVRERTGATGGEQVAAVFTALDDGNRDAIVAIVEELEQSGAALDVFLRQMLTEVRTRLHTAVAAGEPIDGLTTLLWSLLTAIKDVRTAPIPGLVLEASLLRLLETPAAAAATPSPPRRESRLFKRTKDEPPAPAKPQEQPRQDIAVKAEHAKETALGKEALIEAPEVSLQSVLDAWPEIAAKATPAALKMSLKNGRVTGVEGKNVILGFASNFHRERVAQKEALHSLEALLEAHFKRPLRLQCVLTEEKDASALTESSMVDLAEAVHEVF